MQTRLSGQCTRIQDNPIEGVEEEFGAQTSRFRKFLSFRPSSSSNRQQLGEEEQDHEGRGCIPLVAYTVNNSINLQLET